jgi:preprotein translocase subunit SecF
MITKKPIRFTKLRFIFFTLSTISILIGFGALFFNNGFNLGIDFTGGLDKQFQIAPVAFTMTYAGNEEVQVDINSRAVSIIYPQRNEEPKRFLLTDYKTIQELITALKQVENMNIEVKEMASNIPATSVLALSFPVSIDKEPLIVNYFTPTGGVVAPMDQVRTALAPLGASSLQYVGEPERQEYLLKVQVKKDPANTQQLDESEFLNQKDKEISDLLEASFGKDTVLMKKTDFIGASFSIQLVQDAINAVLLTLILILIYVAFRFKFIFGIGALIATVHDVLFMIGVIALFRLEVNSAVLAAILTIIGYSLNDTIVVFDRMRENFSLMPESARDVVIDTSITQSLSRTIITALTTLLAVVCIFIFATGAIKEFALNLIVGIVVGTYSSIFIAAPVVLTGMNMMDKRKKNKEFGTQATTVSSKPVKKIKAEKKEDDDDEALIKDTAAIAAATGNTEVIREQVKKQQKRKKKK